MKSIQELQAIKEKMQKMINPRETTDDSDVRIVVGMATCVIAAGARPVLNKLSDEVLSRGLHHVKVIQTGMCRYEPIVEVFVPGQEKVTYIHMTPEKAVRVINDHIVNGNVVQEYTVNKE